jgi:hypothetical protein
MVVKKFQERKERKKFGLPAVIVFDDIKVKLPARLNDISEGGVSFKAGTLFPAGEVISLLVPHPMDVMSGQEGEGLRFNVQVVWAKDNADNNDPIARFIHGCKFLFVDKEKELKLQIKSLMELSEKLGEKPIGF